MKDTMLKLILEQERANPLNLDSLVEMLYKEDSFLTAMSNFYVSFFIASHNIDTDKIPREFGRMNTFQKREIITFVAEQVGMLNEFLYYEELLKDMNKNYQSNAIDILKATLDNSEESLLEAMEALGEISNKLDFE